MIGDIELEVCPAAVGQSVDPTWHAPLSLIQFPVRAVLGCVLGINSRNLNDSWSFLALEVPSGPSGWSRFRDLRLSIGLIYLSSCLGHDPLLPPLRLSRQAVCEMLDGWHQPSEIDGRVPAHRLTPPTTGARVTKPGRRGKSLHIPLSFHPFNLVSPLRAGSSASTDSGDTTTDTDDDRATLRGRPTSHSRPSRYNAAVKPSTTDATKTRRSSVSSTSGSSGRHRLQPMRVAFTRSKSPLPPPQTVDGNGASPSFRTASPVPSRIKQGTGYQYILPPAFYFCFRTPFSEKVRRFYIDSSKACEATLLLGSMFFAAKCLFERDSEIWTSIGGLCPGPALTY